MFMAGGSVELGLGFFIDIFFEQVYQDSFIYYFIIFLLPSEFSPVFEDHGVYQIQCEHFNNNFKQ